MTENRGKNVRRNLLSGILYKAISILLPFLTRTAILYELGEQYAGLSGLFTSVLQVLNLAELGFSSAIVYQMYQPVAGGDTETVCALLHYYRAVYRTIGAVIFAAGIIIMPWLPALVKGAWPSEINIYFLYLLYLLHTAASYFLFAYKSALLNAVQRLDLVNIVQMAVGTCKYLVQLLVLVAVKSYYWYVITAIVATAAANLATAYIAAKKYPQYVCRGELPAHVRKNVRRQVGGLMLAKISDTTRNSFDSIIVSALFGLTAVAVYNNYYYIFSAVYGMLLVVIRAMQASVGNSIARESRQKNYQDLNRFQFIFSWLMCWCTTCLVCLYQPFMKLWAGEHLLLPTLDMVLFGVYFYVLNMNDIRNLYFTGNGLWWHAKGTFVSETIGNLALNIALGVVWGTTGIILATIITTFVFNFICRTNIVFRMYFHTSPKPFYIRHILYAGVAVLVSGLTYFLCGLIHAGRFDELILRALICMVLPNAFMLLLFRRYGEFQEAKGFMLRIAKGTENLG